MTAPRLEELPNKAKLREALDGILAGGAGVSLLFIDLDGFKQVNDTKGHIEGDRCLEAVEAILHRTLLGKAMLYRFGGDEFAAILPNFDIDEAVAAAERMRREIAIASPGGDLPITASIGVAASGEHLSTRDELIEAADVAMYSSKKAGKNRVTQAGATQTIASTRVISARLGRLLIMAAVVALAVLIVSFGPHRRNASKARNYGPALLDISSNSTLVLQPDQPFNYSWRAEPGRTACVLTVDKTGDSGISLAGSDGPITPDHPWYPTLSSPSVLVFSCTDGITSTSFVSTVYIGGGSDRRVDSLGPGVDQQLAELGLELEREKSSATALRVIQQVRVIESGSLSDSQRVRTAILAYQAYRNIGDIGAGCAALRAATPIAGKTEYAKGLDRLLVNSCV